MKEKEYDNGILPFHTWKEQQIKKDTERIGKYFLREKGWYHTMYGQYVEKERKKK